MLSVIGLLACRGHRIAGTLLQTCMSLGVETPENTCSTFVLPLVTSHLAGGDESRSETGGRP